MKLLFSILLRTTSIWALLPLHQTPIKRHEGLRVIGGDVARAGQFPWQAAIYKDTEEGRYFCGGALISDQWILTAAQCVYQAKLFTIQLGSNSLQSDDDNRLIVTSSTYVINERFEPDTLWHDVGLIKLRMPITFTDYIQSIKIANMGYIHAGRVVEMAGWGQISDESPGLIDELNYVPLSIISNYECQSVYGSQFKNSMTCAVGNYNEGICFGDIGGPLVTPALIGNHSMHIAIASFMSQNGCESLDPSGFTRTDAYYNWINNAMKNN